MALNIGAVDDHDMKPKITVFGVGGAGGNAVNNMINKNLEGVEFVVANTDAQAIEQSRSSRRVQLGSGVTAGLGAGMKPSVGRESAEETIDEIIDHLNGANMCFITAGMGGGTGTGAAPVIAKAARELGVLTVGVVTKPFSFEGAKRMQLAEDGLDELQQAWNRPARQRAPAPAAQSRLPATPAKQTPSAASAPVRATPSSRQWAPATSLSKPKSSSRNRFRQPAPMALPRCRPKAPSRRSSIRWCPNRQHRPAMWLPHRQRPPRVAV